MEFFNGFGLGGENTLAQAQAIPSATKPKPNAATNKTAKEKYGLETIAKIKVLPGPAN